MTTIKLICLIIIFICTLAMIASIIITEIKIRRCKKEIKKLALKHYKTIVRYPPSLNEIRKAYGLPPIGEDEDEERNGSE